MIEKALALQKFLSESLDEEFDVVYSEHLLRTLLEEVNYLNYLKAELQPMELADYRDNVMNRSKEFFDATKS